MSADRVSFSRIAATEYSLGQPLPQVSRDQHPTKSPIGATEIRYSCQSIRLITVGSQLGTDETETDSRALLGRPSEALFVFRVLTRGGSRPWLYSVAALRLKEIRPKALIPLEPVSRSQTTPRSDSANS